MFICIILTTVLSLVVCCACRISDATNTAIVNFDRKVLECAMDVDRAHGILWHVMYEDGTYENYTCPNTPRDSIVDCLVHSMVRRKRTECSCSLKGNTFKIFVILKDNVASLHQCLINATSTVHSSFLVIPETSIHVDYIGLDTRQVSCCVRSYNATVTVNMTQNEAAIHNAKQPCVDRQCFSSISRIPDSDSVTKYGCVIGLIMWDIAVSKEHLATIIGPNVVYTSDMRIQHTYDGACGGRVSLIVSERHMAGRCSTLNTWHGYNNNVETTLVNRNGVTTSVKAAACTGDTSVIHVTSLFKDSYFKIVSYAFYEEGDIFVYEMRIISKLSVRMYEERGSSYIQCINGNSYDSRLSMIALSGCRGDKIYASGYATMRDMRYEQYACIAVDTSCDCGAAWTIRDKIVRGPAVIENVTSYVLHNEHCIEKLSSGTPLADAHFCVVMIMIIHFTMR